MTQIALKRTRFDFVNDPGHGWLLVTPGELSDAGLGEQDITPYSYRHPTEPLLALEEDLDAVTFLTAWEKLVGQTVEIAESALPTVRHWPGFGQRQSS